MPPGRPVFHRAAAIEPNVLPEICKYEEGDEVSIKGRVQFDGESNETEITTPIKANIEDVAKPDKLNRHCTYRVKIIEQRHAHYGKIISELPRDLILEEEANSEKCKFVKDQKVIINGEIEMPGKQFALDVDDLNAIILGEGTIEGGKCVYKVKLISDLPDFKGKEATVEEDNLKADSSLSPPLGTCSFTAKGKAFLTGSVKIDSEEDDTTFETEVRFKNQEVTILKATPVKAGPCYYQVQINSGEYADRKSEDAVLQTMLSPTAGETEPEEGVKPVKPVKPVNQVEKEEAETVAPPKKRTVFKRAKISSLDELDKGGPFGEKEIIYLAGQKYYIDYTEDARKRRARVFDHAPTTEVLLPDENRLLESIGVVDQVRESLKPYLYDFFSMLPSCQSSAQMLTNRKCEASYYVMWSVLLKARQNTQREIETSKKASLSDMETRMLSAGVDAMTGIPKKKDDLLDEDKTGIMKMIQQIEASIAEIKSTLASAKDRNKK